MTKPIKLEIDKKETKELYEQVTEFIIEKNCNPSSVLVACLGITISMAKGLDISKPHFLMNISHIWERSCND